MSEPTAPAAEARPVDATERLQLIDALRGYALLGVFVSNATMWFSGLTFWSQEQRMALFRDGAWYDKATMMLLGIFVFGKFITIFSFLFGLGFAVQLGRAEARGASVVPLYVRRLVVMFLLGVTHLVLIWHGDILHTYAVLGLTLLVMRAWKDRALLWTAAVAAFVLPGLVMLVQQLPSLLSGAPPPPRGMGGGNPQLSKDMLAAITTGGYLDVVRAQTAYFLKEILPMAGLFVTTIVARFCLGLWAGRRGVFHAPAEHRRFFRRLLGWGLVAALATSAMGFTVQMLARAEVLKPQELPWFPYVFMPVRQLQELGLASVYVAAFTLLFQRAAWARVLGVLAPVGRMALTNYLTQSVVSVLCLYGLGLHLNARLGLAGIVGFACAVFVLQVVFSHLWLRRFRFGPVEWVWRSLTYGHAQPMRREAPAPAGTPAPPPAG